MKNAFGLKIPRTLEDVCSPKRLALLVYDMQVGIVSQLGNADSLLARIRRTLEVARAVCKPDHRHK